MYPPRPPAPVMAAAAAPPVHSAVIAKGPAAPTAPVAYSSHVVPGLIDTLMMPATPTLPVQDNEPKPMVNVVYIGGLHSGTSSDFVINIMQKCGKLVNFKRHTDPSSGLLANFALCDFESPKGPYYAMECLANLKFGEGEIKVSCNDKVKGMVDEWVREQVDLLKKECPEKTDEEIRELFKAPEVELRSELENLIKYEVMDMQSGNTRNASISTVHRPDPQRQTSIKSDSARSDHSTTSKQDAANDIYQYVSHDYSVHHKEHARRSRFKSKQRSYDDEFKDAERDWEEHEESLLRKLHRIGTVKRSTRERLVNDDLKGFARSTSSKEREREKELDLEDEMEEAKENASSEVRCTIPLAAPVAQAIPAEPQKRILPNVFSSNVDEEEPIFKRTHRPHIKMVMSDTELWEQVPKDEHDLFAFEIDWDHLLVDNSVMIFLEPWMKKCIMEFMGDDEEVTKEVMEFLNGRLLERPNPNDLLEDVEKFLDEDSRGFVYEMWRRIVFHQQKTKALFS